MSLRRASTLTGSIAIAVVATTAHAQSSSTPAPRVTADDIDKACSNLERLRDRWQQETSGRSKLKIGATQTIASFCELRVPVDSSWDLTPVPTPDTIRAYAIGGRVGMTEAVRDAVPAGGAGAPMLNPSALLWSATDFLIGRTKAQFDFYVVTRFTQALCDSSKSRTAKELRYFMRESCQLLRENAPDDGVLPGVAAVRAALRADVMQLPLRVADTFVGWAADAGEALPTRRRDQVLAIAATAHMLSALGQRAPPADVFARSADALLVYGRRVNLLLPEFTRPDTLAPISGRLIVALEFGRALPQDASELEGGDLLNTLKAFAVNAVADASAYPTASGWTPYIPSHWRETRGCAAQQALCVRTLVTVVGGFSGPITRLLRAASAADTPGRIPSQIAAAEGRLLTDAVAVFGAALAEVRSSADVVRFLELAGRFERITSNVRAERYGDVILDIAHIARPYADTAFKRMMFGTFAIRTLALAADIAQAQDAAAVQDAMERFVAPAGSFARKRVREDGQRRPKYVMLNSYGGGTIGMEHAQSEGGRAGLMMGPYLPIGLEVSCASIKKVPCPPGDWAGGLFIQLVDLGQLAGWRLTASETVQADPPEVKLRHVFAPGIFYILGVPRMPLSFGVGWSWSPKYRRLETTVSTDVRELNTWRLAFVGGMDIPLFP